MFLQIFASCLSSFSSPLPILFPILHADFIALLLPKIVSLFNYIKKNHLDPKWQKQQLTFTYCVKLS